MACCYCCCCFSRLWFDLCGSTDTLCSCFPFASSCWMGSLLQTATNAYHGRKWLSFSAPCFVMSQCCCCLVRLFYWWYFFQSCLDEEGLNHGMFLQAVGSLTMAVAVVLFPLLSVFQDKRTGPRSAACPVQSLVSDFLQHLQPFHFLLQPLTHTCNFKQMVFCLNLLSCPSLSWGTLNLGFWFCFAFNVS